MNTVKIGFVPANRGFFPTELAARNRGETIEALKKAGIEVVVPDESLTSAGCVETRDEARKTAKLFSENKVDGIIIGCMNFGDEQTGAQTVEYSGLAVPVLAFGASELGLEEMKTLRGDALCGLISMTHALRQLDIPYTTPQKPIAKPSELVDDFKWFASICRVVDGINGARIGQVGTRPESFWTCRYDETALQKLGVTVVSLDLSEILYPAEKMDDNDPKVKRIIAEMKDYCDTSGANEAILTKQAKLEAVLEDFIEEAELDALGIQCWTSMGVNYGIVPCTIMSRLGEKGIPCACEADINGAVSMLALKLASESPSALVDWNNDYPGDETGDRFVIFHCGVFPKSFLIKPTLDAHEIIKDELGEKKYWGTCVSRIKSGPLTFARITNTLDGEFIALVCEGKETGEPLDTFGNYGVISVPDFRAFYRNVILEMFPHHSAITQSHVGNIVYEALGRFMGMEIFTPETEGYHPELPF